MRVSHVGRHEWVGESQYPRPNRQEKRHGEGRFPPGSAEHPDERVQTGGVEQCTKYLQRVDPGVVLPVSLQRGEETWLLWAAVILPNR